MLSSKKKLSILMVLAAMFFTFSVVAQEENGEMSSQSDDVVYTILIHGDIELALRSVVARAIQEAELNDAEILIFDIDTFGGRVDAAFEISDMLSNVKIPTVAFINPKAISAGALIALSCKKIVFTDGGTMGAATPVNISSSGESTDVGEKQVSVVRAKFRAVANRNGHDPDLAEAMVDKNKDIEDIAPEGNLLTLDSRQALDVGLASAVVESKGDLFSYLDIIGHEEIIVQEYWVEKVARFFAKPTITGLLMMLGMLSIYVAVKTPGLGVPEAGVVICFLLFFWGHSIAGLAGWETLLLFLLGLILLAIEIFVTPGFGLLGFSGFACILISLIFSLSKYPVTSDLFTLPDLFPALVLLSYSFFGSILGAVILARFLPETTIFHRIVLGATERRDEGYHSTEDKALALAVGSRGVTRSNLRPAGVAQFDQQKYDVVSQGEYIPSGAQIEVLKVEGRRLVVRRIR